MYLNILFLNAIDGLTKREPTRIKILIGLQYNIILSLHFWCKKIKLNNKNVI